MLLTGKLFALKFHFPKIHLLTSKFLTSTNPTTIILPFFFVIYVNFMPLNCNVVVGYLSLAKIHILTHTTLTHSLIHPTSIIYERTEDTQHKKCKSGLVPQSFCNALNALVVIVVIVAVICVDVAAVVVVIRNCNFCALLSRWSVRVCVHCVPWLLFIEISCTLCTHTYTHHSVVVCLYVSMPIYLSFLLHVYA